MRDRDVSHSSGGGPADRDHLLAVVEALFPGVITTDRHFRVNWHNRAAAELFPEVEEGPSLYELMGKITHEQKIDRLLLRQELITTAFDGSRTAIEWMNCERRLPDGGYLILCWPEGYSEALSEKRASFTMAAYHELRGPLASLKGFAELLNQDQGGLSDGQREAIGMIVDATGQLDALTQDILDLALNSYGELTLSLDAVDLERVVRSVVELHQSEAVARCHRLDLQIEPDLPPAEADPARIRQVIDNLVSNACIHNPPGTLVEVRLGRVGDGVEFVVRDHGGGLGFEPPEMAFSTFFRSDGAAAEGRPGSGIGLSLAKRLVELHRGQIALESCRDGGTRAAVWLPLDRTGPTQPREPVSR